MFGEWLLLSDSLYVLAIMSVFYFVISWVFYIYFIKGKTYKNISGEELTYNFKKYSKSILRVYATMFVILLLVVFVDSFGQSRHTSYTEEDTEYTEDEVSLEVIKSHDEVKIKSVVEKAKKEQKDALGEFDKFLNDEVKDEKK